jgi:type IV secretion system protein VirB3
MQESRQEPRRLTIHRSLNRPHLLLGAERGLVLMAGVVTAVLLFSGNLSLLTIALSVTFWSCTFWALVRMGKADPQMSRVYQRHVRYRAYYAARSCIEATQPVAGSQRS